MKKKLSKRYHKLSKRADGEQLDLSFAPKEEQEYALGLSQNDPFAYVARGYHLDSNFDNVTHNMLNRLLDGQNENDLETYRRMLNKNLAYPKFYPYNVKFLYQFAQKKPEEFLEDFWKYDELGGKSIPTDPTGLEQAVEVSLRKLLSSNLFAFWQFINEYGTRYVSSSLIDEAIDYTANKVSAYDFFYYGFDDLYHSAGLEEFRDLSRDFAIDLATNHENPRAVWELTEDHPDILNYASNILFKRYAEMNPVDFLRDIWENKDEIWHKTGTEVPAQALELAAETVLEKNPILFISMGFFKLPELAHLDMPELDQNKIALSPELQGQYKIPTKLDENNAVTIENSNYQSVQRHPLSEKYQRFDFSIIPPLNQKEFLQIYDKVVDSEKENFHTDIGLGNSVEAKSFALVSFEPNKKSIMVEEIQSDWPKALSEMSKTGKQKLIDQYGAEIYNSFMREMSEYVATYPYVTVQRLAEFADANGMQTIKISSPEAIGEIAGISNANKVKKVYQVMPSSLGFNQSSENVKIINKDDPLYELISEEQFLQISPEFPAWYEYTGDMKQLAEKAKQLAEQVKQSIYEKRKEPKPNVKQEKALDVDKVRDIIQNMLGDRAKAINISSNIGSLMQSIQKAQKARIITRKEQNDLIRSINKQVIASIDNLIIKAAGLYMDRLISKRAKVTSDKPAYKEKKKTDTGYVWVYDEKHVEKRWKEKKEKLKKLEKELKKVREQYQKDLTSDDERTRAIAAIVGIMDDTAMRIGNEESAKEGTYGATTLKVKHVKGGSGNMTFDFPGKGAVEQNVVLKNNKVIKVIRDLMKGKKADDFIFEVDGKKIWDRAVNRYLSKFNISAKDLRGFHANRLMKEMLKKKDFKDALDEVAEIVGHEPSTLKNQYLDPELVEKNEGKEKKKAHEKHVLSKRAGKYDHIDFKPPKSVADAAIRGLELRKKNKGKGGLSTQQAKSEGVGSGVQRAVNLKNRDTMSPSTVKRMKAFFDRHQKSKTIDKGKSPGEDKGYIAWLLWGGDPGYSWSKKIVRQMEAADKKSKKSSYENRLSKRADMPGVPGEEEAPKFDPQPMTIDMSDPKNIAKMVNINLNINNVGDSAVFDDPGVKNAWRIVAPFLPPGATITSAFRDDFEQAKYFIQKWRSWRSRWTSRKGYFAEMYPQFNGFVRYIDGKIKNQTPFTARDFEKFHAMNKLMYEAAKKIKNYKDYLVAVPGESLHGQQAAFDISGASLGEIAEAVKFVASKFPQNFPLKGVLVEPGTQNAIHVELNGSAVVPNINEYAPALFGYLRSKNRVAYKQPIIKQQSLRISKRAAPEGITANQLRKIYSLTMEYQDANTSPHRLGAVTKQLDYLLNKGLDSLRAVYDIWIKDHKPIIKDPSVEDIAEFLTNLYDYSEEEAKSIAAKEKEAYQRIENILSKLRIGVSSVDEALILFHEALNTAHNSGRMAEYLSFTVSDPKKAVTEELLNELSNQDVPDFVARQQKISKRKLLISKRAELKPEDAKWVKEVLKGNSLSGPAPIVDVDKKIKKSYRIKPNVKLNDLLLNAWKTLQPFLPPGAVMTSGFRTEEDQKRIINHFWQKATGKPIPDHLKKDNRVWRQAARILTRHHGYVVGPPWTNSKYAHLKGTALDISGANLYDLAEAVEMVSASSKLPVKFRKPIVEQGNNCIHVGVVSATYDESAVAAVLREINQRTASISKRADDNTKKEIENIYGDLLLSDPPEDLVEDFEKSFDISMADDDEFEGVGLADDESELQLDMGFGKEDSLGDWFEKSPIFRWREDIPKFEIHDVKETEASKMAKEDPEKFFYRGLHKEFPDFEAEALKGMIEDNAKFFFIFLYHEREEEEFQDLVEKAAEALSLQDARAFFYYHLHHKFPELGRGAIVQLIDTNPDSFFDFGLQKDYPDLEESAGAARNIKDPNKVELEQPEWLKKEPNTEISLRDKNANFLDDLREQQRRIEKKKMEIEDYKKKYTSEANVERLSKEDPIAYFIDKFHTRPEFKHLNQDALMFLIAERPEFYFNNGLFLDEEFSHAIDSAAKNLISERPEAFLKLYNSSPVLKKVLVDFLPEAEVALGDKKIHASKKTLSKRAESDIKLTSEEEEIFQTLKNTIENFNLGTTVRVAGGWVRDKMMGLPSKDIDIAVDNMMGKDFAEYVRRYAKLKDIDVSAGVIPAKPEQGKHLETAVIHMLGQSIDVVNLRDEEYDEESRKPVVTITDSPVKDAFRRDLTINSLFYNIHTNKVEDFTGQGVDDIKNKVLRTPQTMTEEQVEEVGRNINAKQIYLDDPLRVLRAIRFANRYPEFSIDPEIVVAAKDPDVQEAFRTKITWERRQDELSKIMSENRSPREALELIKEWGYRSELLALPDEYSEWELDQNNPYHEFNVWGHLMEALDNIYEITKNEDLNKADRYILNWATLLHDVGKLDPKIQGVKEKGDQLVSTFHGHENSSIEAAQHILTKLKGTRTKDINRIKNLIDVSRRVDLDPGKSAEIKAKTINKILELTKEFESDWQKGLQVALADAAAHKGGWLPTFPQEGYNYLVEQFKKVPKQSLVPLISGMDLQSIFNRRPGKWIGQINKELQVWQTELATKGLTPTKEEAKQFVLALDSKGTYDEKRKEYLEPFSKEASISKRAGDVVSLPSINDVSEYISKIPGAFPQRDARNSFGQLEISPGVVLSWAYFMYSSGISPSFGATVNVSYETTPGFKQGMVVFSHNSSDPKETAQKLNEFMTSGDLVENMLQRVSDKEREEAESAAGVIKLFPKNKTK